MPKAHQTPQSKKSEISKSARKQTVPLAHDAAPAARQSALDDPLSASPAQVLQLQQQYGNRAVQRSIQRAQAEKIQRESAIGMAGGAVGGDLQNQINSARGGGQPLDQTVGSKIGGVLGADFSGVKIHTDSKSDSLNRSLSAKAFTTGSDIFFSKGGYNPGTHSGKQLLAHELTHVVQQGAAGSKGQRKPNKVQTKLTVGPAGDKYEQEADAVAAQVMAAPYAPIAHGSAYNGPQEASRAQRQIHRSPDLIQRGFMDKVRGLFGGKKKGKEIGGPTNGKDYGSIGQYDQGALKKSSLRPVVSTYDELYDKTCGNVGGNWGQKIGSDAGKKHITEAGPPSWVQKKYPEIVGKKKGRFGRLEASPDGFHRAPSGAEVNEFMTNAESRAWLLAVVNKWYKPEEINFLTSVLEYRRAPSKDAFMAIFRLHVADNSDESIHVDQGMKEKLKELAVSIDPTAGQARAYQSVF